MKEENKNKKADFFIGLLAILAVLFLLWGATACKQIQYVEGETIYKEVKVVERDTTIITEADSASVQALLYCDSAYNVVLGDLELSEGERINLEWRMALMERNGRSVANISIDCREDSLMHEIALRDSIINTTTERNIIQHDNVIPNYYKNTSKGFWVLFVVLLLELLYAVYKILHKFGII